MVVRFALALACLVLAAPIAVAGPWLREEGAVFLAFGQNLALSDGAQLPVHYDPFLYAEWGATERLTLSLNLYAGDAGRERVAEAFVIAPLALPENWGVASATLGLAVRQLTEESDGGAELHTLFGGGLSWGKGLPQGWVAVDARIMSRVDAYDLEGKIDLTWGHRFTEDWAGMIQLQAGHGHTNDTYCKIAPTLLWSASDRLTLTLGVSQGLTGDKGTGLTLGGWLDF